MQISKLGLLFGLSLAIPSIAFSSSHKDAPTVVATIKPLQLISAAITEGVTETELLLPPSASPHDYHLKPSDVRRINNADLIIWVGPELESFVEKPLKASKAHKLALLDKVEKHGAHDEHGEEHGAHEKEHDEHEHHEAHDDHGHEAHSEEHDEHDHHDEHASHEEHDHHDGHASHEEQDEHEDHHEGHADPHAGHNHGDKDPHIWFSPEQATQVAELIAEELAEIDPKHHDMYEKNLKHFKAHLAEVDREITKKLAPVKDKGYFVFHDAYEGFEEHYGLNHLGAFTVSPERQPGAKHLAEIQHELKENKAVCIFKEPQFKPAVIAAVTKGTDVKIGELDPLASDIAAGHEGYFNFLNQTADSFLNCLK